VTKGEEAEYALYNKVKTAEYARQKQEQQVRRLSSKLLDMRRQNAIKIKEEMTEISKEEEDLTQRLLREQALLKKVLMQHSRILCLSIARRVSAVRLTWLTIN
jgi:hypothetical protein